MKRNIVLALLISSTIFIIGCGGSTTENGAVSCNANGDTPTAAYKRLFDAVKLKNTESIKAELTKSSVELGEMMAARFKKSLESSYENGLSETTFSPILPEMRDERINCNMGSVEIWNSTNQRWDDIPFMIEDGKWKLAFGDQFKGTFKSPGKGMATRQAEAANAARGNVAPPASNVNTNKPPTVINPANSANLPTKPANK